MSGEVAADTHRPGCCSRQACLCATTSQNWTSADLLAPSDKRTRCPYKGEAIYWSVVLGDERLEDVVWSYPAPLPEIPRSRTCLAFTTSASISKSTVQYNPGPTRVGDTPRIEWPLASARTGGALLRRWPRPQARAWKTQPRAGAAEASHVLRRALQVGQQVEDGGLDRHVKRGDGCPHNQLGLARERPGDGDALFEATG